MAEWSGSGSYCGTRRCSLRTASSSSKKTSRALNAAGYKPSLTSPPPPQHPQVYHPSAPLAFIKRFGAIIHYLLLGFLRRLQLVFWLGELPHNVLFTTENGTSLERIKSNKVCLRFPFSKGTPQGAFFALSSLSPFLSLSLSSLSAAAALAFFLTLPPLIPFLHAKMKRFSKSRRSRVSSPPPPPPVAAQQQSTREA